MDVRVGLWRKLSTEEFMLLNCGAGEDSWEFSGKQRDQAAEYLLELLAEAEAPVLWPPDAKSWLIWKDPDAGKDWRQEEKGTTKDEMVGWYHQLNGHEFEQAMGIDDGQGGLVCYSPWGCKESDMTEQLTWNDM